MVIKRPNATIIQNIEDTVKDCTRASSLRDPVTETQTVASFHPFTDFHHKIYCRLLLKWWVTISFQLN